MLSVAGRGWMSPAHAPADAPSHQRSSALATSHLPMGFVSPNSIKTCLLRCKAPTPLSQRCVVVALAWEVWSLVCVVAVHAMDRGRAKLWALTRQRADATGLDQARITDYYQVLGATAAAAGDGPVPGGPDREVAQASAAAVATFWGSVVAFAETVEGVPRGWPDDLRTDHPFRSGGARWWSPGCHSPPLLLAADDGG